MPGFNTQVGKGELAPNVARDGMQQHKQTYNLTVCVDDWRELARHDHRYIILPQQGCSFHLHALMPPSETALLDLFNSQSATAS